MNDKKIYDLELHEALEINNYFHVKRVAGGWIYETQVHSGITTTFVPYNDEFKTK